MGLPRRTRSHVRSTTLTQDHVAQSRATCPPSSAGFAAWVFCDRLRPGPLAETLGSNERRTRQHRSAARRGQRPGIAACQSQLAAGSRCARPRCSGARRPCSAATAAAAGRPTGSATRVTRVEGFVRAASPGRIVEGGGLPAVVCARATLESCGATQTTAPAAMPALTPARANCLRRACPPARPRSPRGWARPEVSQVTRSA